MVSKRKLHGLGTIIHHLNEAGTWTEVVKQSMKTGERKDWTEPDLSNLKVAATLATEALRLINEEIEECSTCLFLGD